MRTFTRLVLYALVGISLASDHADLLIGLACVLLIEVVFRSPETALPPPRRSASLQAETPTDARVRAAHQARLAEIAREAARRAQERADAIAKMRES